MVAEPVTAEEQAAAQPAPDAGTDTRTRKQTSFGGDVLKLVSGTTVAQAIGVLVTPLLTRMYGPEAFGILALFTSITGIIGVVACLRYELAIMLPESDEEAANLLAVSLFSVLAIALLTVPLVTWGRPLLLTLLSAPQLGPYLWLVPPVVFLAGVFQALSYWQSRSKEFGPLSAARVVNTAGTHLAKLGAGAAGYATVGALIGSTAIGPGVSALVLSRRILRADWRSLRCAVRPSAMWSGAVRHRRFPLVDLWGALMNVISTQLPVVLFAAFFSATTAGYYALGHRVLTLPMSLVGGSIGQVFFQRASAARSSGTLAQVVESTLRRLVTLSVFPFTLLAIIGSDLFGLVFGSSWREAGLYAAILAPWTLFVFIGSPISTLYCVLERQAAGVFFSAGLIVTRALALTVGGISRRPELALGLFSASGALLWAGFGMYLANSVGLSKKNMAVAILRQWAVACLILLPIALLKWFSDAAPLTIVALGVPAALAYYWGVLAADPELRESAERLVPALGRLWPGKRYGR